MSNFTANGTIVLGERLKQCYDGETDAEGLRHGQGVYTYANAAFKYEGEYVKGEKHGKGKLTLSDGSYFEGTFQRDEIVGHGTRVYSDGSRYEGLFLHGEAAGLGVYSSAQGWKIHAHFSENRPVGQGKWESVAGDTYEGAFDGKFDGQGVLRRSDGYVYTGHWKGGKKHGQGTEEMNGESYAGDFHNDLRHGTGTLTTVDGRTYTEVQFCDGAMQQAPGRLRLEYQKNIDKKGTELPVALDLGVRVPTEFTVQVAVEPQASKHSTAVPDGVSPADEEADSWRVFAEESGRRITVRLYQGHPQPGQDLGEQVPGDVIGTWSPGTASPGASGDAPGACADGDDCALEHVLLVPEVCLTTVAGLCSFSDFQIGGGSCEVAAGAYTLVFSSDGVPDEVVAVTMGAKGKGK